MSKAFSENSNIFKRLKEFTDEEKELSEAFDLPEEWEYFADVDLGIHAAFTCPYCGKKSSAWAENCEHFMFVLNSEYPESSYCSQKFSDLLSEVRKYKISNERFQAIECFDSYPFECVDNNGNVIFSIDDMPAMVTKKFSAGTGGFSFTDTAFFYLNSK